jgi:hypothetical protein
MRSSLLPAKAGRRKNTPRLAGAIEFLYNPRRRRDPERKEALMSVIMFITPAVGLASRRFC